MTEEQLNNIDKPEFPSPIQGWKPTAQEAIQAVNRLLWSDGVEDDDHEEAKTIKAFLVDTLQRAERLFADPNTPAPVKHSKTIPVMETTIEGAQRRIEDCIEWVESELEWLENEGYSASDLSPLHTTATNLEYIGVFLDSVGDEMAAISTAYQSLHDRYLNAIHAANDNA